jgi:DNA-binding LacI/PurR family transcriptional regulator
VLRGLMTLCAQSPDSLRIGQNVGLAGHDNLALLSDQHRQLTTIDYSLPAMAEQVLSCAGPLRSFRRVQAQVIIGESL